MPVAAPRRPHIPVLLDRVTQLLADAPVGPVVDATLGAGGHARGAIEARLARYGQAHLVGFDRDPDAIALARDQLADLRLAARLDLVHATFDQLDESLDELGIGDVAGVLYDLGISSMQVDRPQRGFGYRHAGPLDMRMDPTAELTADTLVNHWPQAQLARVLRDFGEERFADRVAAAIVAARPIHDTVQLADIVRAAIPAATRRTGPHPATRTFQGLRIAVNRELDAFANSLPQAVARLAPGGVCVVLAYHSLEDRIAKRAFADAAAGCICPPDLPVCACGRVPIVERLTARPERPGDAEVAANPRARSARLRAVRKLAAADPEAKP